MVSDTSLDDFLAITEIDRPNSPEALFEELSTRLSEWRDRIDFYQDQEALGRQYVLDQITLLMQIVDETFDSIEHTLTAE